MIEYRLFVDGSYDKKNNVTSWAYILVNKEDEVVHQNRGILTGEICSMFQVGGELQAVIQGLTYCSSKDILAEINYDYTGIFCWVSDIFGIPAWKAKNQWTQAYREFILSHKNWISKFVKVKAHTGNKFNEAVDKLAKANE